MSEKIFSSAPGEPIGRMELRTALRNWSPRGRNRIDANSTAR